MPDYSLITAPDGALYRVDRLSGATARLVGGMWYPVHDAPDVATPRAAEPALPSLAEAIDQLRRQLVADVRTVVDRVLAKDPNP